MTCWRLYPHLEPHPSPLNVCPLLDRTTSSAPPGCYHASPCLSPPLPCPLLSLSFSAPGLGQGPPGLLISSPRRLPTITGQPHWPPCWTASPEGKDSACLAQCVSPAQCPPAEGAPWGSVGGEGRGTGREESEGPEKLSAPCTSTQPCSGIKNPSPEHRDLGLDLLPLPSGRWRCEADCPVLSL